MEETLIVKGDELPKEADDELMRPVSAGSQRVKYLAAAMDKRGESIEVQPLTGAKAIRWISTIR